MRPRRRPEALALFEERLVALNRANSTRRLYLGSARRFLAGLGKPIAQVTAVDVLAYVAVRRSQGVETCEQEIPRLSVFMRTLVDAGLLSASPIDSMTVPRRRLATRAALSPESIAALLAEASDHDDDRRSDVPRALSLRDRCAVEILFATGLRATEACAILVTDLDPRGGGLRVRPVKRGTPRTLPVPRKALVHVRRYLSDGRPLLVEKDGRDLGHLLVTRDGRPMSRGVLLYLVQRAARRAGFHAYPHAIRRGLATAFVRAGAPIRMVQHLLGHASLASTQHYVATDQDELRRAVERIDLTE